MATHIEKSIRKCKRCKKNTKHHRSVKKSSALMLIIHVVLILMTAGLWIPIVVVWALLNASVGGWSCKKCGV